MRSQAEIRELQSEPLNPVRIAELLEPFLGSSKESPLTPVDYDHISTYIDVLLRWNARVNLTAIRDPEEIVTRHFGEALFTARRLFPDREQGASPSETTSISLGDVGSGAGFPGLPIKLWAPQISVTLIESKTKKATFLREVARILTLTDVNVLSDRAESLTGLAFDVVTLRAVERFESVLSSAASFVALGGRLALLIGDTQISQAKALLAKSTETSGQKSLQVEWSDPLRVPRSTSRALCIAIRRA